MEQHTLTFLISLIGVLFGLLIAIIGYIVKQERLRVNELVKEIPKKADYKDIENLREKLEDTVKDIYEHHDRSDNRLRQEVKTLSEVLRIEIKESAQATNTLISQLIQDIKK